MLWKIAIILSNSNARGPTNRCDIYPVSPHVSCGRCGTFAIPRFDFWPGRRFFLLTPESREKIRASVVVGL